MGKGLTDFTAGSTLDIFWGTKLKYQELDEKYRQINNNRCSII
ncbi:MAG: hypothetical protein RBR53_07100 [Desulforegulaceae bacterium]|nr:hypothetical protein [Desulforegulaceae bacterium]